MKQLRAGGADVVRNGYLPERDITTAIGDVSVEVPRIRSLDGKATNFASSMIPKYLRRSASISPLGGLCLPEGNLRRRYRQSP
jgi:putative transposase